MRDRIHQIIFFSMTIVVSATLAAGIGAFTAYKKFKIALVVPQSIDTIAGKSIIEDMIVQEYRPHSNEMLVALYFRATREFMPVLVRLAETFTVGRQDAIVENGIIIGATPVKRSSLDEMTPGTRGAGVFTLTDSGVYELRYLLIGDPFPRP